MINKGCFEWFVVCSKNIFFIWDKWFNIIEWDFYRVSCVLKIVLSYKLCTYQHLIWSYNKSRGFICSLLIRNKGMNIIEFFLAKKGLKKPIFIRQTKEINVIMSRHIVCLLLKNGVQTILFHCSDKQILWKFIDQIIKNK